MTIVTFLGMVDGEKASYRFDSALMASLKLSRHEIEAENMLPLLLHIFSGSHIIAVGTREAIARQKELLRREYTPQIAKKDIQWLDLPDTHDFHAIFRKLGELLDAHDELVVDITHSFRHIPTLMVVDMVIENIKDPNKIRHILFAREREKESLYLVMDLREYLTLANISYALASFTNNYTITTTIPTRNRVYQALLDELASFGDHILANSLEALLFSEGEQRSIAGYIRDLIHTICRDPQLKTTIGPLLRYLEEIDQHMKEILQQTDTDLDERYHYFAKLMLDKGYLLNALTLLDEALAAYCVEGFRRQPSLSGLVEEIERMLAESTKGSRYDLSNTAKNIVKLGRNFRVSAISNNRPYTKPLQRFAKEARKCCTNGDQTRIELLKKLISDCDETRNNLAHANSAKRLDDVRREIQGLLSRYEEICCINDPFGRFR